METKGIMQEIRELLESRKTSGDVIAQGYAPSSVHKALRQVRSQGQSGRRVPTRAPMAQANGRRATGGSHPGTNGEDREELREEIALLRQEAQEGDALRAELEEAKDRLLQLEADAEQVPVLRARVAALEFEAHEAARLRGRVQVLQSQLHQAINAQASMCQSTTQWGQKYSGEATARLKATSSGGCGATMPSSSR